MDQNHQTLLKANKPALLEYFGYGFFRVSQSWFGSVRVLGTTVPKHESGPGAVFVDL